jgi:CheY-like chemotaxis protein/GAF domain-containing protein
MDQQPKPSGSTDGRSSHAGAAASGRPLRRRADGVLAGQKEALELALGGAPAASVLGVLTRTAEIHCEPGTLAAVLQLADDDGRLRLGAGSSLPPGLRQALDGIESGEPSGPCGAAVRALEPVGVLDLRVKETQWPAFRTLALGHGLKACWALPIAGQDKRVLGVLVLCWREPHAPTDEEAAVARELVHTAALVLERDRLERRRAAEEHQRDEFLSTLAHELRNPLAPLANALELLARAGNDAPMAERARSIMSRQLSQFARLLDELSDLSRSARETHDAEALAVEHQPPLPMELPAGEAAAPVPDARRVLVADDNDLVRESFVELLKSEGYEVRTAADGLQAVELAEQWRPQVVMLDIHMPRLSGLETARRLRAEFPPQSMKLLMMSGMTLNDAWVRHAKAAGFDACLDKTADPRSWLTRMRELLSAQVH